VIKANFWFILLFFILGYYTRARATTKVTRLIELAISYALKKMGMFSSHCKGLICYFVTIGLNEFLPLDVSKIIIKYNPLVICIDMQPYSFSILLQLSFVQFSFKGVLVNSRKC
jgi:hypothetical protein